MPAPAYEVEDRSILLPFYKRLLIDPTLPLIPAWIRPNAITHAGHLACLAALLVLLPGRRPLAYVASAVLAQVYVWCDNADGGHARRTGQSSSIGEYLDHGLDLFNSSYSGILGVFSLGLEDTTIGVMGASMVGAVATVTAWEQAETGVYRLDFLNQIESTVVLSILFVIDAFSGPELYARVHVLGVSLTAILATLVVGSTAVGMLGAMVRVGRSGKSVAPALGVLAWIAAIGFARAHGGLGNSLAYVTTAAGIITVGLRALRARCLRTPIGPLATYAPAALATLVAGYLVTGIAGLAPNVTNALAVVLVTAWGVVIVIDAVALARHLGPAAPSGARSGEARDG